MEGADGQILNNMSLSLTFLGYRISDSESELRHNNDVRWVRAEQTVKLLGFQGG
jgi:hypothetical protein